MPEKNTVHVAVAVLQNSNGQYLIAKRHQESHQGGLWEFPGGKVENNESVLDALKRELFEEVGVTVVKATPLIQIHHDYNDKSVLLDVFTVDEFTGKIFGKEDQKIRWINSNNFSLYDFPVANTPIIKAIGLPDKYMITGEFKDEQELLAKVLSGIKKGIKLIQFRAHNLTERAYFDYAKKIYVICHQEKIKLLLNTSIDQYIKHQASKFSHGLHLTSIEFKSYSPGVIDGDLIVATSIHNENELLLAEKNNIGLAVLSPVNKTQSHPDSIPLGWDNFKQIVKKSNIPVFALGGMTETDLQTAKLKGAQGIAAISTFWNS